VQLQLDDIYSDFEATYRALSERRPSGGGGGRPALWPSGAGGPQSCQWSSEAASASEALAESMARVDQALKRAASVQESPAAELDSWQQTDSEQSTRAHSRDTNTQSSVATTGQGPALVEEMTLSDLEEEICSSLMAAKDDQRQRRFARQQHQRALLGSPSSEQLQRLALGRRSREPLPAHLLASVHCNLPAQKSGSCN